MTIHRCGVVKLWEQYPGPLLAHEGLLPLATLCRAESSEKLLGHVAERINHIKDRKRRRETLNWSRVMAGFRYDKRLITGILKESDMLEESVIYQDIFRKGKQRGVQQGAEQEARKVGDASARTPVRQAVANNAAGNQTPRCGTVGSLM